jgi:predicted RNase H-like nuclease (RuvC/YqgF family)
MFHFIKRLWNQPRPVENDKELERMTRDLIIEIRAIRPYIESVERILNQKSTQEAEQEQKTTHKKLMQASPLYAMSVQKKACQVKSEHPNSLMQLPVDHVQKKIQKGALLLIGSPAEFFVGTCHENMAKSSIDEHHSYLPLQNLSQSIANDDSVWAFTKAEYRKYRALVSA